MANLTDAYEKKVVDGLTGVTPLTTPTTTYLALFSADPTDAGIVANEILGNGYLRTALTAKYSASADGSSANTAIIDSSTATADWLDVTHVGIMEAGASGVSDMMVRITLDTVISVVNGAKFTVEIGDLIIIVD